METGYKYQVDFLKSFSDGILKGLKIKANLRFCTFGDAKHFAMRDGLHISPFYGDSYTQESSVISAI